AAGDVVEGFVAGIKPFGVFVDLPVYGRRVRGLVPREETGLPREGDLAKQFSTGDPVEVEVLELREGKIRLRLRQLNERADERSGEGAVEPPGERAAERSSERAGPRPRERADEHRRAPADEPPREPGRER